MVARIKAFGFVHGAPLFSMTVESRHMELEQAIAMAEEEVQDWAGSIEAEKVETTTEVFDV